MFTGPAELPVPEKMGKFWHVTLNFTAFSGVKSNGHYIFHLLEELKVTGLCIFQLFRALKVMGRYIFQLLEALQVTRCYIFQLLRSIKVMGLHNFQLLEILDLTAISLTK